MGSWDPVNRFNHTSWMVVVTATDRPKSVHNRCEFEVFFFLALLCYQFSVEFSVGIGAFVIGLNQISFFFSFSQQEHFQAIPVVVFNEPIFYYLLSDLKHKEADRKYNN